MQKEAEEAHKVFLVTPIMEREAIIPTSDTPEPWLQLESWMRPKLLEVLPKHVRDWVDMRAKQGLVDASHVLLFYLMKTFSPGGAEEKITLTNAIHNPLVCANPRSAQVELLKWKDNLLRSQQLGCPPPDLLFAYRAMESIFSAVFDKAEPQLNIRWVNLRNHLGLPHVITLDALRQVSGKRND